LPVAWQKNAGEALMHANRPKIIAVAVGLAVLIGAVATGRHLLADGTGASSGGPGASVAAHGGAVPGNRGPTSGAAVPSRTSPHAASATGTASSPTATGSKSGNSGLASVPTFAVTPQVVHTAVIDMRVGQGRLEPVLRTVAFLAGADGGYVTSSSVSGGTVRRSPIAGAVTFRVLDTDFNDAVAKVARLGTVQDQQIQGKDVTVQVARNAASIVVLQDEVDLLETKLAQAVDITTFLAVQGQLFPVEQQLQQLQSAQDVLQNSAVLATVTVNLTAPGAPVVPMAKNRASADAASTAWRYLHHNTLAVLDGLAVAFGWALPVLVPLALVGLIVMRVIRRRRRVMPAA
jgi:hypothetical protein